MQSVKIAGAKKHSSVNGPGVRYVLFMQGCSHHCPGCQNPETHDISEGVEMEVEEVVSDILATRYLDGLTLSGGDPLFQPEASFEIAKRVKESGLDIWMYTGWTFEQIMDGKAGQKAKEVLSFIDVLVDGPYVEALRSEDVIWRGSTNQHLVDVKKSLEHGHRVEHACQ